MAISGSTELEQLFHAALERPDTERAGWLDEACRGRPQLRAELQSLLGAHRLAGGFLEQPAPGVLEQRRAAQIESGADELSGLRIGAFVLEQPIGEGGMGVVYEARQDEPQRRVALKLLKVGIASARQRRRFLDEAQLLARLQHPGIAQVHQSGLHAIGASELPWFALELVRGARPIHEWARERELDMRARVELFLQVASAVQHAHERGILHRDLKPTNLLVGLDGRVKVIDFGIARTQLEGEASVSLGSASARMAGTLRYMSPEQCSGASPIDARSDVYALGLVLYELVCRTRPYELSETSLAAAARQILETPPRRPRELDPRIDADLETILLAALRKEPAERYASVAALACDLEHWLRGEPIAARPASSWYWLKKLAQRNPVSTGLALLLATTLLGSVIALSMLYTRSLGDRARALTRASEAWTYNDLLLELIATLQDGSAQARDASETPALLDKLEQRVRANLAPGERARLFYGLGLAQFGLQRFERARALLEDALAEAQLPESGLGSDFGTVVSRQLAEVLAGLGDWERALPLYREIAAAPADGPLAAPATARASAHLRIATGLAQQLQLEPALLEQRAWYEAVLAHWGEAGWTTSPAATITGYARLLRLCGRFEEADQVLAQGLELLRERGLPAEQVQALVNVRATVACKRGRFADALAYFREAAELRERAGRSEPDARLHNLNNQALCLAALGQDVEARALFESVLKGKVELLGERDPRVGHTHYDFAEALRRAGEWELAEQHARQALEILSPEDVVDRDEYLGSIHLLLGQLELRRGAVQEAERSLREARSFRARRVPAGHHELAEVDSALGECLVKSGRTAEGARLLAESRATLERVYGTDHPIAQAARARVAALAGG